MPSAAERAPGDPGLARERTALSWQRLALGFVSLAALTLGAAAHRGAPGLIAPAALLFALAGGGWRYARRRVADPSLMPAARPLVLLAAATGTAALIATVLVFVRPA